MTDFSEFKDNPTELMRKAKEGESWAFAKLYELYFTPVFRFIYFRVKSREEAEDLTQTVFLKVYQAREQFTEGEASIRGFFFTVARNAVIDYWRKKKDVLFGETAEYAHLPDQRETPDQSMIQEQQIEKLKEAIAKLTDEQQEIILLKFINGLSNKEIASIVDKSEDAVRQMQCRAIRSLRINRSEIV